VIKNLTTKIISEDSLRLLCYLRQLFSTSIKQTNEHRFPDWQFLQGMFYVIDWSIDFDRSIDGWMDGWMDGLSERAWFVYN